MERNMKPKGQCTSCLSAALLRYNKCAKCKPKKDAQIKLLMDDVELLKQKLLAARKALGSIKVLNKPKSLTVLQDKNKALTFVIRMIKKELQQCLKCKCPSLRPQTIFLDQPVEVRCIDQGSI